MENKSVVWREGNVVPLKIWGGAEPGKDPKALDAPAPSYTRGSAHRISRCQDPLSKLLERGQGGEMHDWAFAGGHLS